MQRFRPHLTARGLTEQQWRVIRALAEIEQLDVAELSEHCCIHSASLSRMLPKLAAEKLIARVHSREDQRRVLVSLTTRGRLMFSTLRSESEEIYRQLTDDLGAGRLGELYRVLDESIEALARGNKAVNTSVHD